MKRRTFKLIKKLIEILLYLIFLVTMIVLFIKFVNADDVFDKVDFGFWCVILLIVTSKEW